MKKAIAMLLAVSASMSMGVSIFADSLDSSEQDLVTINSSSDASQEDEEEEADELLEELL